MKMSALVLCEFTQCILSIQSSAVSASGLGPPLPHIPARCREYSNTRLFTLCVRVPPSPYPRARAPPETKTRPQSKTTMAASNTPSVNGFASYFHLSIGGFKNFHTPRLRNTINGNLRYFSENCETGAPAN